MLHRLVLGAFVWAIFSARAIDVERFELLKGLHFTQSANGVAHLNAGNAYRFTAQVYATAVGNILSAAVTNPRGSVRGLERDPDGNPFRARDKFDDAFRLENSYPNGAYAFVIRGLEDGERTMAFSLTGNVYPNAPVLKNLSGAQALPDHAYSVLEWEPMAGGVDGDFIQLQITDVNGIDVFETPDFGERGALNGRSTRVIIEPGTLKASGIYLATLHFCKVLQTTSAGYPGAFGRVGYFSRTEFYLRALATGLSPAVDRVEAWKTQRSEQREEGAPFLQLKPYRFSVEVDAVRTNALTLATIRLPTGTTLPLEGNAELIEFDFTDDNFTNFTVFNDSYRPGAYLVSASRPDGSAERVTMNFAPTNYPPMPNIRETAAFAAHRAEFDLPVQWAPWPGTTEFDFIRVELLDEAGEKVWDTPGFTKPKHLRGNAVGTTIPAEAFIPGRAYTLTVTFFRATIFDSQSLGGGLAFGGYAARTKYAFATLPADTLAFGLNEGRYVWQRGDNSFEPNAATPFVFEATALASAVGHVTNVQLSMPVRTPVALAEEDLLFRYATVENSMAALGTRYPAGLYAFKLETLHDGVRTAAVTLASIDLPPIPRVRNFAGNATIPAGLDAEISWHPWEGFQTNTDTIRFTLFDPLGSPVNLIGQTETEGAITNVAIFQGTLQADLSYLAKLRFERRLQADSTGYPGPRGTAVQFSETWFYVSTLDRNRLIGLTSITTTASRQLQFRVRPALLGRAYRLEVTSDFLSWMPVQTNLVTGSALQFTLPTTQARAFFRPVLLP